MATKKTKAPAKKKASPAPVKKVKAAFKEKTIATPVGTFTSQQDNKKHVFVSAAGEALPLKDIRSLHRVIGSELKRIDRFHGKA